jgi:hypothetical protein
LTSSEFAKQLSSRNATNVARSITRYR